MLRINAKSRSANCCTDGDPITTGSVGYPVQFVFSSEWDGLQKIVVFNGSGQAFDVPLINADSTVIPHEVLTQAGKSLQIGVYGANGDGDIVIPTVYVNAGIILPGTEPSEVDPSEPTPSWAIQVQAAAVEAVATANAVKDAADAGEFDGEPGVGVPTGGSAGQVLAKASGADFDTHWVDQSGGGGASDYNDLTGKPQINGVTLSGNKTPAQLGLAAASDIPTVPVESVNGKIGAVVLSASDVGALPSSTSIPTKVSDLTNDSGFVNASGAAAAAPVQSVNGKTGAVTLNASDVGAGTYSKPSGGIPASDLAQAVQTSLGKADSALQSVPSTYRTAAAQDAIDGGKIDKPSNPSSGAFLVWNGSAWVAQTLAAWQGGSY